MAINYPGSLDDFTNPAAGNTLDSPSHSGQHSDLNDAVEALEAKVGIGASPAGSATAGYVLVAGTADTTWNQVGYEGITSGTATAGQVLTAQGGGTAIWETPALVHINTTTTGGNVASISLDNVFTATYDNYLVEIYGTFAAADFANLRLRVGGSDNSTASSYLRQALEGSSTSASAFAESNTSFRVAFRGSTNVAIGRIYFYRPFLASTTFFNAFVGSESVTGMQTGYHNQSVSYDGFSLIANSNQFNATIVTYGLRK